MSNLMGTIRDGKFQEDNLLELPDNINEHTKAMVNQLITWSADTKGPTDLVMALWFCEIKAKEMIQQSGIRIHHTDNRFLTRKNLAQQAVINLDDLAIANSIQYI